MGWFLFIGSWLVFGVLVYGFESSYIPPKPIKPLEEKFVITTFEKGYCTDAEKLTTRLIRTVESVKID